MEILYRATLGILLKLEKMPDHLSGYNISQYTFKISTVATKLLI